MTAEWKSWPLVRLWERQDAVSKAVTVICLLLVLFAYLPTLQFDYATSDQWRAFRYSTEAGSAYDRGAACVKMLSSFYPLTGRPLVWFGECIEHAAVVNISDFIYLRPIMFAIVVATIVLAAFLLAPAFGELGLAVSAISLFVVSPGYSFMYMLGMSAAMCLIAIALSILAYHFSRKFAEGGLGRIRSHWRYPVYSFLLFFSACLIYPVWAFLVVTLCWLDFLFDTDKTLAHRARSLIVNLAFYFIASIAYYGFVKLSVAYLRHATGHVIDLGSYEVTMQLTPDVVLGHLSELLHGFWAQPPLDFTLPAGSSLFLLLSICAYSAITSYGIGCVVTRAAFFAIVSVLSIAVVAFSISPWLFSKMESLDTRHIAPWYIMNCFGAVRLLKETMGLLPGRLSRFYAPVIVLVLLVLPAMAAQNRLSFLQVAVVDLEIETLRADLDRWISNKGWVKDNYLLVVLPHLARPAVTERLIDRVVTPTPAGDNARLASGYNPVSIPWMITAVLRRDYGRLLGKEIRIVDCGGDFACAGPALASGSGVVVNYTYGAEPIYAPVNPYVINLSTLTSEPVYPVILHGPTVTIEASSQLDRYGPQGLLLQLEPGWHAAPNPTYPQVLKLDFGEERTFSQVDFLPQDDHADRAPKAVRISVSEGESSWIAAGSSDSLCEHESSDGWRTVKLAQTYTARRMRIEISANCGSPSLLTLRGLKLE